MSTQRVIRTSRPDHLNSAGARAQHSTRFGKVGANYQQRENPRGPICVTIKRLQVAIRANNMHAYASVVNPMIWQHVSRRLTCQRSECLRFRAAHVYPPITTQIFKVGYRQALSEGWTGTFRQARQTLSSRGRGGGGGVMAFMTVVQSP